MFEGRVRGRRKPLRPHYSRLALRISYLFCFLRYFPADSRAKDGLALNILTPNSVALSFLLWEIYINRVYGKRQT